MTVKFEFELSDKDASNLIDILQSEQTRALAQWALDIPRRSETKDSCWKQQNI